MLARRVSAKEIFWKGTAVKARRYWVDVRLRYLHPHDSIWQRFSICCVPWTSSPQPKELARANQVTKRPQLLDEKELDGGGKRGILILAAALFAESS